MLTDIRLLSQQLAQPVLSTPRELVSWMGAVQAQEYNMAKWAIGVRLKDTSLRDVEEAVRKGDILRTHIMRPTWHFVAAEDIRWMLRLTGPRIKTSAASWGKALHLEITESLYTKCNKLIEKLLEGNQSLTKREIGEGLSKAGIETDDARMTILMMNAEAEGIVCNGTDAGKTPTYALLEERVASGKELHREEALAKLAQKYFRSHSPAGLQDFTWWSGQTITDAKKAIGLIRSELIEERWEQHELFVHESYNGVAGTDDVLHFLPSYDEYLISYKERTTVIDEAHHRKAFNTFGIFYPVILYNGKVVGNWKKLSKKNTIEVETSFFEKKTKIDKRLLAQAEEKYRNFML